MDSKLEGNIRRIERKKEDRGENKESRRKESGREDDRENRERERGESGT